MDRITELTSECFNAIAQLRAADALSLPAPARLHAQLVSYVEELRRKAAAAGYGREEANDIAYPVVALADEIMQGKESDQLSAFWTAQPLQLHFFGENVAGEAFFTRLERLRRDKRRSEAVQAYYLALAFGFQGRYRVRGGELELLGLTESLARELTDPEADTDALSPSGERPDDRGPGAGQRGLFLWGALGLLGLSVLTWLVLRLALSSSASEVVSRIAALAAR
ncbi:MAG: DotU/TssL family secretion system protein [Anaeromyxobacter sp.]